MKKVFLFFVCCVYYSYASNAFGFDVVSDFYWAPNQTFNDDLIVKNDVVIENHGTITGNISIQSPTAVVTFINSGIISGNVSNMAGADVQQYIHSGAELNAVGNLSGHDVFVETKTSEKLNLGKLLQVAQTADSISVQKTSFILNSGFVGGTTNINVTGDTVFYVENMTDDVREFFTNHVSGSEHYIHILSTDSLFSVDSLTNGVIFARQTALGTPLGKYLDVLRDKNPKDKLLAALDSADNLDDFNNILSRSVRVHPEHLMDFTKTFSLLNLSRNAYVANERGIIITPFYINSDNFSIWGANANLVLKISDNFLTNFGLFGGNMRYDGDFDEFSGVIYGTDFGAKYETANLFVRLQGMLSVVNFDDTTVFDGEAPVDNPTGVATNMEFDLGPVFSFYDSVLSLKPFVGVNVGYLSVIENNDTNINADLGIEAEYAKIIDGNKYGYGAKTFVQTDGAIFGGVFVNMMSTVDGIGGTLNAAILDDDNGRSYKVSLDINFIF